jgi:hypothetical protein
MRKSFALCQETLRSNQAPRINPCAFFNHSHIESAIFFFEVLINYIKDGEKWEKVGDQCPDLSEENSIVSMRRGGF